MTYAERLNAYQEARAAVAAQEEKKKRAEYDLTEIINRKRWIEDRAEIDIFVLFPLRSVPASSFNKQLSFFEDVAKVIY